MSKADSIGAAHDRSRSHSKSPSALKTISEAAELLDVPQHVLRFWETKFSQIKPLKRNGGRRYYRPEDIEILLQIKNLLYKQGYTIKGAKKLFESKSLERLRKEFSDVGRGEAAVVENDNVTQAEAPVEEAAKPANDDTAEKVRAVQAELRNLSEQLRART